jgi:uncharacterized membrane protein
MNIKSERTQKWIGRIAGIGALVILFASFAPFAPQILASFRGARLHAPDWALWAELSPAVQAHIIAALIAFLVGVAIFLQRKGSTLHKTLGWGFVIAMTVTAGTSLFITGINGSSYSLIHIISGWTLIALPLAIVAIRNKRVESHRRGMTGLFIGGLLLAGGLTFLPGRFMFEFLFG